MHKKQPIQNNFQKTQTNHDKGWFNCKAKYENKKQEHKVCQT